MACRSQIQTHVPYVMEAREKMREAETAPISKLDRLTLLQDATELIDHTILKLGNLKCLTDLREECYDQFLRTCGVNTNASGGK